MDMIYSIGNKKIGKDTVILNLHTGLNCPAKETCLISNYCYAAAMERLRPNVRANRAQQERLWETKPAKFFINNLKRIKSDLLTWIRFQETGDFANQADVDKLNIIAEALEGYYHCYTYTCRHDLDFSARSKNLVITGSYFMADNMYVPLKTAAYEQLKSECPQAKLCPNNCRKCALCKVHGGNIIYQKIH